MEELTMDELLSGKVTREKNAGRESAMNNYQKRVFFEEHILPHYEGLYYFALKTMQHKESAEDAVQSTLERAWKHIDKLKDETKAKTWLFTIARNQMYTILSKRKSR